MVPVSVAAAASYQGAESQHCASHAAGFPESTAGEMERRLLATAINAARRGHLIMLFLSIQINVISWRYFPKRLGLLVNWSGGQSVVIE